MPPPLSLRRLFFYGGLAALSGLAAPGCGDSGTPDSQVRAALQRLESAAERSDVGDFTAGVSEQYLDQEGRDAAAINQLVRGYFVLNQPIHLLTRIERIEFPTPHEAQSKITVAMVGSEAEAGQAWSLAAEVQHFDLTLRREDDEWRVIYARWRRPD